MRTIILLAIAVNLMTPVSAVAQTTLVNLFFEKIDQITVSYDTLGTGNQVISISGLDQLTQTVVTASIYGIDRGGFANESSSVDYCHEYARRVQEFTSKKKPEDKLGMSFTGQGDASGVDINLSAPGHFVECSLLVNLP